MNRVIVSLLAALDAVLAAAGGLAIALAPLTLLWVFGFGGGADWGTLWPVAVVIWQLGHLVPITLTLPGDYLAATAISPDAAQFVISLAPLAFAVFTASFAARSGGRAALAGAPVTGPVAGTLVFAVVATATALTGRTGLAAVELWQAVLLPVAVFAVPCTVGALVGAWRHRIAPVARLRERVEALSGAWGEVPGLIVRGAALTWTGLVGVGALLLAVAVALRGGQVVALFQAGNVDAVGATVLALGQLVYLPTLLVWALSFAAGPGFSLGAGSAVSPSGTQTGVVPGIPALGLVPESTSPWLLLLVLLPVGIGALAGWMLRSRLADRHGGDGLGPRLVILGGVTVLSGAFAALLAACAAGSIGPGRLSAVGPEPGPVALTIGLEVAIGAAILLLAPRRRDDDMPEYTPVVDAEPLPERPVVFADLAPETRAFGPGAGFAVTDARVWADSPRLTEPDAAPEGADEVGESEAPAPEEPDPADDPGPAPEEQATEPIVGFERGSGRPSGSGPGSSLD